MKALAVGVGEFVHSKYSNDLQGQGRRYLQALFENMAIDYREITIAERENFITELHDFCDGYDYVVVAHVDSVFYCQKENQRLWNDVQKYRPDYGFGDTYPEGVVLEFLSRDALPVMENVRRDSGIKISKKVFQEIIHKDINMFDLENLYADVDLRTLRLSFFSDNQQDVALVKNIQGLFPKQQMNKDYFFKDVASAILANKRILRTSPKYFEVEVTNVCSQACVYCPRSVVLEDAPKKELTLEELAKVIDQIKSISADPVISLTGMGDALNHPSIGEVIELFEKSEVDYLVETSGVGLDEGLADQLIKTKNLKLIFSIDAISPELHQKLRPSNDNVNFSHQAWLDRVEYVLLRRPDFYVQLVKMNENFPNIVAFHKYFEKYTKNIIIQKYNHYRQSIPERRLNPMQPFEKIDCWHLKRDMVIKSNGNVVVCKQDIKQEHVLGNILKEGIEVVWEKGQVFYEKHLQDWDYCKNCDEYYTYNF